ncbi:MAG: SIS domain-containing protein, partial [Candidatus Methanomethylicaceae archaeon]
MLNNIAIEQIGPHIRLIMNDLTEKEQKIVKYCLAAGPDLEKYSVYDVAASNEVSPAMVVKVAHRCGFSGYREMKNAIVAYSRLPVVDLHEELNPNDDPSTVVEKVFKTAINAIEETLAIIDPQKVAEAAEAIKKAKNVDIYGVGGSGALALDAYHKFLRIGIRTHLCIDSHMILMSANLLDPSSVALAFSHSGRSKAI